MRPAACRGPYRQPRGCLHLRCAGTDSAAPAASRPSPPASPSSPPQQLRLVELKGGAPQRTLSAADDGSLLSVSAAASGRSTRVALSGLLQRTFLPDYGAPGSTTPDYVPYQLWSLPTHILGGLSSSLATSSMLQAVGIGGGAVGAVAGSAAIKWIAKDGIGSLGRALVGSRLGAEFDDDPRRWRMLAEGLATAGRALEIATPVFPGQFLLLASSGTFLQAVAKGLGKPVFRVIQTHFAAAGNVGAVAAKEEVWEVVAAVAGYAASVLVLQWLEASGTDRLDAVAVWALVQGGHVLLRYQALLQLRFSSLNHKRACMLVRAHVATGRVPGVEEANLAEPMLPDAGSVSPPATFGCSLAEAWGRDPSAAELQQLLDVYAGEQYLLLWRGGRAYVVLRETCGSRLGETCLKALWQAAWLMEQAERSEVDSNGGSSLTVAAASPALLQRSLQATQQSFQPFLSAAADRGWDTDRYVIKAGPYRLRIQGLEEDGPG